MPSFDTHVYEMLCDITISLELVLNLLKDHVLFFFLCTTEYITVKKFGCLKKYWFTEFFLTSLKLGHMNI